ncbi:MAG: hypothetical protein ACLP2P_03570 [Desulfobaccales bacterium]
MKMILIFTSPLLYLAKLNVKVKSGGIRREKKRIYREADFRADRLKRFNAAVRRRLPFEGLHAGAPLQFRIFSYDFLSALIVGKGDVGGKFDQGSGDDDPGGDDQHQEQGVNDDAVPGIALEADPEPF